MAFEKCFIFRSQAPFLPAQPTLECLTSTPLPHLTIPLHQTTSKGRYYWDNSGLQVIFTLNYWNVRYAFWPKMASIHSLLVWLLGEGEPCKLVPFWVNEWGNSASFGEVCRISPSHMRKPQAGMTFCLGLLIIFSKRRYRRDMKI